MKATLDGLKAEADLLDEQVQERQKEYDLAFTAYIQAQSRLREAHETRRVTVKAIRKHPDMKKGGKKNIQSRFKAPAQRRDGLKNGRRKREVYMRQNVIGRETPIEINTMNNVMNSKPGDKDE